MKRLLPLAALALAAAGCSNAPVAGLLDSCCPSRATRQAAPPAGPPGGVIPDVRPTGGPTELPPPRNP